MGDRVLRSNIIELSTLPIASEAGLSLCDEIKDAGLHISMRHLCVIILINV